MRAAVHTPRGPFRHLERRHCLAEIVERGVGVSVERLRVKRHPKTLATENNILSTRAMQRRVIEELTPTGEWSIIVSKRRAFVRLLKKP